VLTRSLNLAKNGRSGATAVRRGASIVASRRTAILCTSLAAVVLVGTPRAAHAYTIQSPVTRGCHEEITIDAWRRIQAELPDATAAIRTSRDDEALIADVPFDLPDDLQELGLVTLLLGIRENDIADLAATSLSNLAVVNSDSKAQRQHCLRTSNEDEPDGSQQALEECQDFIRETLASAVDVLGDDGLPDPKIRDELEVTLAVRGKVKVQVPAFQLRAAHAIHALQDSFTHSFRNPDDPTKIRVILNFSEYAENTLDEAVDGPPHLADLDRCDDADALRTQRHRLAIEASAEALRALLDPPNREAKLRAINDVVTKYTSFDSGSDCTFDNEWCAAPEREYDAAACACRAAGAAPGGVGAGWPFPSLLALLGIGARVRRRREVPRRRWHRAIGGLSLGLLAFAGSPRAAHAQDRETGGITAPIDALAGNSSAAVPGHKDTAGAFFGRVALGASYDKPGFSGGLGLRYQLSQSFMIGFDGEWNPWLAITPGKLRTGAANGYFSLIRRFQLRYEAVNVRTTLSLGGSYLLFDLVGARKGSFGPYFGLSLLGIEWKMARGFYLTIDPTNFSFPVPHVTGVPFGYWQYRFLLGLEFGG
jgi:hypothetical protein